MQSAHWILTDEEWCELCFALMDMSTAHEQLQAILLADNPPSLRELWQATSSYKDRAETLFETLGEQLRARVDLSEHNTPR